MDLHLTRSSMGGSASLRSASWADGSEKDCRWATPLLFVRRCGSSTAFNKRLWHTQHLRWDQPMPLNVQNWPGSADEIVQQWDMKKRKIDLLVRMRSANGRWAIRVFFYEDWSRKIFVKTDKQLPLKMHNSPNVCGWSLNMYSSLKMCGKPLKVCSSFVQNTM